MRSIIIVTSASLICCLLVGCGSPSEVVEVEAVPTDTMAPLGYPGNPVTSNSDWEPVIEEFNGVKMALVPVGCFNMGRELGEEDEKPVHEQCFNEPFYIDVYEVTYRQYSENGPTESEDKPVRFVNWFEALAFCQSRGGRLPSEAEWEYAARGPDDLFFPWGNSPLSADYGVFWYPQTFGSPSIAISGSKPLGVSWIGAHDLIGNVWELTRSIYQPYPYAPNDGREVDGENDTESSRVTRGGGFSTSQREQLYPTYRKSFSPARSDEFTGFRCIRPY
jgi:sulfatase modifying factor 1